jgi:hypothetical protein
MDTMKDSSRARSLCIGITVFLLWWGAAVESLYSEARAQNSLVDVVSSPSGLTVEAHGVGVEEVLREMGERIGFTVVAKEAAYPTVDVSIKDATPEEALQQVLRGENYAIVYRRSEEEQAQEEQIDKVLLLSPPNAGTASPNDGSSANEQARPQASIHGRRATPPPGEPLLPEQATATVFSKDGWKAIQGGEEGEKSPSSAAELLRAQVLQTLADQNQQAETNAEEDAVGTAKTAATSEEGE